MYGPWVRVPAGSLKAEETEDSSPLSFLFFIKTEISPGGEIGRHVRLRGVFRKMCWFESSPGHQWEVEFFLDKNFRGAKLMMPQDTEVAELVDAHVSGACAARREGSSPSFGTN